MNMVEKVAIGQAEFDGRPWISMPKTERERYMERARLAISDLLEPSEQMIDAGVEAKMKLYEKMGWKSVGTKVVLSSDHPAGTIYVAMMEAARSG